MKNKILFILLITFTTSIQAKESRTSKDIIDQREIRRQIYRLKSSLLSTMVIIMPYGESEVISSTDRLKLKTVNVFQVDVIFTDYPRGDDLKNLNLRRIKVIESLRRDLVSNPEIRWNLIRQTGCNNESEAKTFFHGIVIHYRDNQTREIIKKDLSFFDKYVPKETSIDSTKLLVKALPDKTIFKVLDRNKQWKKMTIVADLTGSMAPYISQLILWFKLNMISKRLNNVVFFNDGDEKPNYKKVIGSTGGIYKTKATSYNSIRRLALTTISNGHGGDFKENDCEALIAAIKFDENAKEIILIADNSAPVKDLSLIKNIKKPVRIILCGTRYGINVQYMNLARETGGSVHTMEKDLVDLIEFNEGKKFIFEGVRYLIKENRVTRVLPRS